MKILNPSRPNIKSFQPSLQTLEGREVKVRNVVTLSCRMFEHPMEAESRRIQELSEEIKFRTRNRIPATEL